MEASTLPIQEVLEDVKLSAVPVKRAEELEKGLI